MFHKVVKQHMQVAVGVLISTFKYRFTKQFFSDFLNRFRFDRIMVVSLWPHFWPALYTMHAQCGLSRVLDETIKLENWNENNQVCLHLRSSADNVALSHSPALRRGCC